MAIMPKPKKKWKCNTCKIDKKKEDEGMECDICSENSGLECTSYNEEVVKYLKTSGVEVNFICHGCTETLPDLKNMLEITRQHLKLQEDVKAHDTRITTNQVHIETLTEQLAAKDTLIDQMNTRLATLEVKNIDAEQVQTIAQRIIKDTDFPPLTELRKTHEKTIESLEAIEKRQNEDREEIKRKEAAVNSLIVYGIPEGKDTDKAEQMKLDYNTIKQLYEHRVPIHTTDLLQVSRVGNHKENKIRPIKITFTDMQKRLQVLRNNKNLLLYGEDECEFDFCQDEEHHKHIYVSTDKTQQQRNEERALRDELKKRKETDADLIIRNGKIIKKKENQARWAELTF